MRSGPNAPATSAQIPPTSLPNEGGNAPPGGTGDPATGGRSGDDPPRTSPPPDHRVLGGPPVPGATQPQHSEGFVGHGSPVPERPGARPDASTTNRQVRP
jgi:hypothetical protein